MSCFVRARNRMDYTWWEPATFSPRRILLFSPSNRSVMLKSNINLNVCSKKNTEIKARRACELPFTKKQAKEKGSCLDTRSLVRSQCVSHGYGPTPRLFRTSFTLLCECDVALASPIAIHIRTTPTKFSFKLSLTSSTKTKHIIPPTYLQGQLRKDMGCVYRSLCLHWVCMMSQSLGLWRTNKEKTQRHAQNTP